MIIDVSRFAITSHLAKIGASLILDHEQPSHMPYVAVITFRETPIFVRASTWDELIHELYKKLKELKEVR